MAGANAASNNPCGCAKETYAKSHNPDCVEPSCKECKVCCDEYCGYCKKECKAGTDGKKCKCRLYRCACPESCYGEDGDDNPCKGGNNNCDRCKKRCTENNLGKRCICVLCNCGCSYGLCNCCIWCPDSKCDGRGTCDGFVLKQTVKVPCESGKCKGHGVRKDKPCEEGACPTHGEEIQYNCFFAKEFENGKCIARCNDCGGLCGAHVFYCIGSMIVAVTVLIFASFIAWNTYPEKFRKVFYGLRAAFANSTKSSGASTNLAGGRIHEEMDTDEYSAFPFKGLM
ncbi:hypothetical protein, conserved [Babesia ovata]|uniref:Uncharacterized protein n=1 Tax=Babesia ovata TaxID=189622 RepID=A0A2H6K691_9APIC|nr:uncharacterized protein BOVATA_000010 [Babesia ovata]GBE58508.1 hypothetical protein, conserved [Babesia ovata]